MKGSASSAIGHKGEIFVSSTVARHDRNHLYWVMLVTGSVMTFRCDQLLTNVWEYNSVPLLVKVRRDFSTSHCHHACNWTPTRLTIWLAVTCWWGEEDVCFPPAKVVQVLCCYKKGNLIDGGCYVWYTSPGFCHNCHNPTFVSYVQYVRCSQYELCCSSVKEASDFWPTTAPWGPWFTVAPYKALKGGAVIPLIVKLLAGACFPCRATASCARSGRQAGHEWHASLKKLC